MITTRLQKAARQVAGSHSVPPAVAAQGSTPNMQFKDVMSLEEIQARSTAMENLGYGGPINFVAKNVAPYLGMGATFSKTPNQVTAYMRVLYWFVTEFADKNELANPSAELEAVLAKAEGPGLAAWRRAVVKYLPQYVKDELDTKGIVAQLGVSIARKELSTADQLTLVGITYYTLGIEPEALWDLAKATEVNRKQAIKAARGQVTLFGHPAKAKNVLLEGFDKYVEDRGLDRPSIGPIADDPLIKEFGRPQNAAQAEAMDVLRASYTRAQLSAIVELFRHWKD